MCANFWIICHVLGGDGVRTMTISGVLAPSPPTYRRALRPAGLRRNGVNCAGQVDWLFGIEEEKKRCVFRLGTASQTHQ